MQAKDGVEFFRIPFGQIIPEIFLPGHERNAGERAGGVLRILPDLAEKPEADIEKKRRDDQPEKILLPFNHRFVSPGTFRRLSFQGGDG